MGPLPSRLDHRKISLTKLTNATDGFSEANLLGVGNFGKVLKGVLNDGTMVAIKVLSSQNEQVSRSFVRECNVLRRVRHRNLFRIITTYSDPDFKALILPLIANGSLNNFLHPEGPQNSEGHMLRLDLIQRLNIAIDIAQALEYLHHHCFVQVIHCDIKPSNVLLGEDMTAYLTDFGISRLISGNSINSFTSTDTLKGSVGYMAPEYGVSGRVTTKRDVYNYGIMLLQMVTGKRSTEDLFVEGMNMQKWVSRSFPNTIAEVGDSSLLNGVTSSEEDKVLNCLRQLISMSFLCTKESPQERAAQVFKIQKMKAKLLHFNVERLPTDNFVIVGVDLPSFLVVWAWFGIRTFW
ncbi:putative leucine-rich repeat receptor-like serine/threonine-protein kinase At2g24130 [Cryptomeria japonica]|uniref:putative leucine-rich repeat receptor-like serine/threonine-protein kinase At2g24130 n=1 Tax=Cryptomeria japonica TaxID=3369 RepID=UPI0027DA1E4F|nr:putative leucine-rich repeat receptor-like serine/threonine-protein kinase At2g24130 [Cryptomeria japonica]